MWKTVGVVAGSLAAGTLMVGSALPVAGAADYDDDTLQDFRVRVVLDAEHFVDNPPKREESPGDVFMFTSNLHRHGEQVGRAAVQCTLMPGTGEEESLCTGAVDLHGQGQITVQVLLNQQTEDERFAAAITGGTGKFKGANGQMIVIDPPGPREHWLFDFHPSD